MASAVFVDKKAAQEYLCPICLDVMTQPVQVECRGGHLFCKGCVDKLIQSTPLQRLKCPICGTKFDRNSRSNPIQYIQRKINDLRVICPYHSSLDINAKTDKNKVNDNDNNNNNNNNDNNSLQSRRRSKRLSGKKRKRPDDENKDDDIIILNTSNPSKRQKIDNTECCDWSGRYGDFMQHINQCPFELVLCYYSFKGCKEKIRRKDQSKHHDECPFDNLIVLKLNYPPPKLHKKLKIKMRKQQSFGSIINPLQKKFNKTIKLSFDGEPITNYCTPQRLIDEFDIEDGDLIDTHYK